MGCGDDSGDSDEPLPAPRLTLKAVRSAVPDAPNALKADGCVIRGSDSDQSFFVEVDVFNFELKAPGACALGTACGSVAVQLWSSSGKLIQHTLGITEQIMVPTRTLPAAEYELRVLLVQSYDVNAEYLVDARKKPLCTDCEQRITIAARCRGLGPADEEPEMPTPADAGVPSRSPSDAGGSPLRDASARVDAGPPTDGAAPDDAAAVDAATSVATDGSVPSAAGTGGTFDAGFGVGGDTGAGGAAADDAGSAGAPGQGGGSLIIDAGPVLDARADAGADAAIPGGDAG